MDKEILNLDECASFLGKSVHTLKKYVKDRVVPHYKKEGSVYFFKSEILEWIKDGKRE